MGRAPHEKAGGLHTVPFREKTNKLCTPVSLHSCELVRLSSADAGGLADVARPDQEWLCRAFVNICSSSCVLWNFGQEETQLVEDEPPSPCKPKTLNFEDVACEMMMYLLLYCYTECLTFEHHFFFYAGGCSWHRSLVEGD